MVEDAIVQLLETLVTKGLMARKDPSIAFIGWPDYNGGVRDESEECVGFRGGQITGGKAGGVGRKYMLAGRKDASTEGVNVGRN